MKERRERRSEGRLRSTVAVHVTHAIAAHACMTHTQKRSAGFSKSVFLLFFSSSFRPPFSHPRVFLPAQFHHGTVPPLYDLTKTSAPPPLSTLTAQLFFLPFLCLLVVTFNGSSRCKVRALETHERHDFLANDKRNDSVARFFAKHQVVEHSDA